MYDLFMVTPRYHATDPVRCLYGLHRRDAWIDACTPQLAVVVLCAGRVRLRPPGRRHLVELTAGGYFLRHPQLRHRVWYAAGTTTWSVAVPGEALGMLAACGCRLREHSIGWLGEALALDRRCTALAEAIRSTPGGRRARLLPELLTLLLDILQDPSDADAEPWQSACRILDSDHDRPCSLAAVARRLGMHPTTFRNGFTRRFGQPPMRYRIRRRLERAAERLAAGCSVQAVAADFGYCDAFAFSRQFRAHMGCSPSHWRRLQA